MVGYLADSYPIDGGNCFDLIDTDGSRHRVVNFGYENLKEWMKRTGQKDITVRFVTKIDKETGEEQFDHWEPANFRQLIKEKYNIDVK